MISTKERNLRKTIFFTLKTIALILVICFVLEYPAPMIKKAQAAEKVYYVSDIKIFQAKTVEDAQRKCEQEGYICTKKNLNAGAGKGGITLGLEKVYDEDETVVIMGYKVTENKNKALYDISLLHMDDGYQIKDYAEANEEMEKSNTGAAETMYASANEFAFNYKKGSPKAKEAYEGLNLFSIPEAGNAKLGDYIISKKASVSFFAKVITRASAGAVNAITNFLATGLTPMKKATDEETGEKVDVTWATKVKDNNLWEVLEDENTTKDEFDSFDKDYRDEADAFFKQLQQFATNYENGKASFNATKYVNSVKGADVEDVVEDLDKPSDADNAMIYVNAYKFLNEHEAFEGMPLGEYLVKIGKKTSEEVDLRRLYPILDSMSSAQRKMVGMSGILSAISSLGENKKVEEAESLVDKAKSKMKELMDVESFSIWINTNPEMADKKVAFTSDAIRLQGAGKLVNAAGRDKWDDAKKTIQQVMNWINVGSSVITVATWLAGQYGIAGAIVAAKASTSLISATAAAIAGKAIAFSAVVSSWAGIFSLVLLGLTIIFAIVTAIIDYIKKHKAKEYTDMPDYTIDTRSVNGKNVNLTYKAVKDDHGRIADLNAYRAQTGWVCMYATDDPKAGSAIRADENGNVFNIVYGDANNQAGYDCASYFGQITPGNCNTGAKKDEVNGIYINYYTENSLKNRPNSTEASTEKTDNTEVKKSDNTNKKLYYSDLVVVSGKSPEIVKSKIAKKKGDYKFYDQNLCPDARRVKLDEPQYTYIGYQTTTDPDEAIRDIRVGTFAQKGNLTFGELSYAWAGHLGYPADKKDEDKELPEDLDGLFYTIDKNAGTPIEVGKLHLVSNNSDAKAGWEPVTTFSGLPYNFATSRYSGAAEDASSRFIVRPYSYTGYMTEDDNKWENQKAFLYYEPEKKYTSGTKYLSGVFFAFGTDSETGPLYYEATEAKISDFYDTLSAIPFVEEPGASKGVNLAQPYFYKGYIVDSNQKYLRMYYTWSYNPHRALTDVKAFRGVPYLSNLPYTISKAVAYSDKPSGSASKSASYAAATVAVQRSVGNKEYVIRAVAQQNAYMAPDGLLGNTRFDEAHEGFTRESQGGFNFSNKPMPLLPTNLYVTGYVENSHPLTLDDVVISKTRHDATNNNGTITCNVSDETTLGGNKPKGDFSSIQDLKDPHSTTAFNISYPSWTDNDGDPDDSDEKNGSHFHKASTTLYMYIKHPNVKARYISRIFVGAAARDTLNKEDNKELTDDEKENNDRQVDLAAISSAVSAASDEIIHYDVAGDPTKSWYNQVKAGKEAKPPKKGDPAAYVSVARTDDPDEAVRSILLFKSDNKTVADQIRVDGAVYYCASAKTPIKMSNGKQYFLYYSHNQGTVPGKPFTELDISEDVFISGRATALVVDHADVTEYNVDEGKTETKTYAKPHGDPTMQNFIHGKYEAQKVYYNKIFTASADTAKEAQLGLLEQGCTEFCNIDLNKGAGGKCVYFGYRGFTLNQDKINSNSTAEARALEEENQLQEAVYDIICTVGEEFHPEGILSDRYQIYYAPVAMQNDNNNLVGTDLNDGTTGPKIYMYYTTMHVANKYNKTAKNDPSKKLSAMPKDYLHSPLTKIGFALNDYVPYSKDLEASSSGAKEQKAWEYVMNSDNKSHLDLNEGAVSFDSDHMMTDNRITMFAQREDGSVKKSAEITGGYSTALITENKLYLNK